MDYFNKSIGYNPDYETFDVERNIDFSKDEVRRIRDLFRNMNLYVFNNYKYADEDNQLKISNVCIVVNDRSDFSFTPDTDWSGTIFYAVNTNDKWIYAMDFNRHKYYICDQFSGLLKFIKDKFIYTI